MGSSRLRVNRPAELGLVGGEGALWVIVESMPGSGDPDVEGPVGMGVRFGVFGVLEEGAVIGVEVKEEFKGWKG